MKTGQILMYLKELPRATCLFKLLHVYFAISIQVKHLEGNFKISLRSCKYKEERKDRREEGRERGEKKKNIQMALTKNKKNQSFKKNSKMLKCNIKSQNTTIFIQANLLAILLESKRILPWPIKIALVLSSRFNTLKYISFDFSDTILLAV